MLSGDDSPGFRSRHQSTARLAGRISIPQVSPWPGAGQQQLAGSCHRGSALGPGLVLRM